MLSLQQIRLINSLQQRKFRQKYNRFKVEGIRSVNELLVTTHQIEYIVATPEALPMLSSTGSIQILIVKSVDFEKISSQKTPQGVLAIVALPQYPAPIINSGNFYIALDDIQDPGNLGTIIRIADWYGISDVLCTTGCADIFNPKSLQSSMGAAFRVRVHYQPVAPMLEQFQGIIYGALLDGADVHQLAPCPPGILLIGNEGNGISNELMKYVNKPITIPRFGQAESLNAAVATGILMDNLMRINR